MGKEKGDRPHLPQGGRAAGGRTAVQSLLRHFGLSTDKRLGQHFLVSERAVERIVARTKGARGILEIGPGIGVLTVPLGHSGAQVTAIEVDKRLLDVLAHVAPNAKVVQADALKCDVPALLRGLPAPRCIVSNMPYNITGPLLGVVTECRSLIRNAVLMMQKEVGERVLAAPGTPARGALSVSMQLQFEIAKVCDVKAVSFLPQPKVDSVVLDMAPRADTKDLERVLDVVRAGFKQPRKTLANNLIKEYGSASTGLPANIRPHQLTNEEWTSLAMRL